MDRVVSRNACAVVHQAYARAPQASRLPQDSLLTCMASQAHQSCSSTLIRLCHVQQRCRRLHQRLTWHKWEEGMVLLILIATRCNALKKHSVPDQQAGGSCTMVMSVSGCSSAFDWVKQLLRTDGRAQQLALHRSLCLVAACSCMEGG